VVLAFKDQHFQVYNWGGAIFEFRLALGKNHGGRIGSFGFDGMKNGAQGIILRQPREALR
jgi:hypothetical protein